jgi:hypothetical protein
MIPNRCDGGGDGTGTLAPTHAPGSARPLRSVTARRTATGATYAVAMDSWFVKIELELTTGRTFRSALTRDETIELAKGFVVQEDQPDSDIALTRAAFNTLAYRADAGAGGLVLPDSDGRAWYFKGASIAASASSIDRTHRASSTSSSVSVSPKGRRKG